LVPLFVNGKTKIDIDSHVLDPFTEADENFRVCESRLPDCIRICIKMFLSKPIMKYFLKVVPLLNSSSY
jgi:hypothetical protein